MKRSKHLGPHHGGKDVHEIVLELVNNLDAMVAYWDADQVCVFANNAYRYWFGKSGSEVIGLTLKDLLGPLYEKNLPYIEAAYQGQRRVFEREIPTPSGIIRHSLATYTPHVVDGKVQGIFVHVADVSSLKKLEQELKIAKERAEKLATHDFLTGLPNRVLLVDTIKHAIAVAKRRNHWVAVISLDMDDFKQINDTYGHGGGDQLLIDVASRLKTSLRESDTVARLGGDEFLLVGAEIESNEQVETMAKRILETVAQPLHIEGAEVLPTISIGIALYPHHGATPVALIAASDRALYLAKKRGKHCYAMAGREKPADGRAADRANTRRFGLRPVATSLHRHRHREIARLIDVGTLQHGDVIGQQLQRYGEDDGRDGIGHAADLEQPHLRIALHVHRLVGEHDELAAACFYFMKIRFELFE